MSRIVGGKYRGRRLVAPPPDETRPTSARMRSSIFNVLQHRFMLDFGTSMVMDVFSGTGGLGLEAISRGALSAIFVDCNAKALEATRKNADHLGVRHLTCAVQIDAATDTDLLATAQKRCPDLPGMLSIGMHCRPAVNLVFLDPPYRSGLAGVALHHLVERQSLHHDAIWVMECARGSDTQLPSEALVLDQRSIGRSTCLIGRVRSGRNKTYEMQKHA